MISGMKVPVTEKKGSQILGSMEKYLYKSAVCLFAINIS